MGLWSFANYIKFDNNADHLRRRPLSRQDVHRYCLFFNSNTTIQHLQMPCNLLTSPRWKAEHLGLPMPDSPHAVSVSLPLWEHNIKYEEGDAEVIGRLQAAYPRFCLHPFVRRLCLDVFGAENAGLIFPSTAAAQRAVDYVVWRGGQSARLVALANQNACGVAVHPGRFFETAGVLATCG